MAKEKTVAPKDIDKKIVDLKIELLKQTQKRKSIKKQIARLLTMKNAKRAELQQEKTTSTKAGGKTKRGN